MNRIAISVATLGAAAALVACGGGSATVAAPPSTRTSSPAAPTTPATATTSAVTTTSSVPVTVAPGAPTATTAPRYTAEAPIAATRTARGVYDVAFDSRALQFHLMPGTFEPAGQFAAPTSLTPALRPSAVAAFNGGFKFKDSGGGFYIAGVTAKPLVNGAASFVIENDGTATVGRWGRDVAMGPRVAAVLQNLHLMVDHGVPTDVSDSDTHRWGSTFPKESTPLVPRSGVCVTAAGAIHWVGGPGIGAATLADTMVASSCVRGMELDINPRWVSFSLFDHPTPATIRGHNLYDGQRYPADSYLGAKERPWILVSARRE